MALHPEDQRSCLLAEQGRCSSFPGPVTQQRWAGSERGRRSRSRSRSLTRRGPCREAVEREGPFVLWTRQPCFK